MNGLGEVASSVRATLLGTFQFKGRSRRRDIMWYYLVISLIAMPLVFLARRLNWESQQLATQAIDLLVTLPYFALFARLLHDQSRPGRWVVMLLPVVAANIYRDFRVKFHAFDPQWPDLGYWQLALAPVVIASMVFMLVPGTVGANRYGPDPRADEERPASA